MNELLLTSITREPNTITEPNTTTEASARKKASSAELIVSDRLFSIRKSRDSYMLNGLKTAIKTDTIIAIARTIIVCRDIVSIDLGRG